MLRILFLFPLVVYVVAAEEEFWSADIGTYRDADQIDDERLRLKALQIQCTRRFSPGRCLDEVKPVWTYNFHLQNCTERLGCREQTVTNRFTSYKSCMESCQSLIKIYNLILSQGSDWNDTERWQPESVMRRGGDELDESLSVEVQPEEEEEQPSRYHSHDLYLASLENREDPDQIRLAEVLPPNIDYQAPEFNPYDPIHRPRHVV